MRKNEYKRRGRRRNAESTPAATPVDPVGNMPTIAIVGRPNVGKSSLFNAIIGRRVSIVHEMPGVTRDRVVAPVARGTRRFQLIDTGGLGMMAGESRNVDMWDSRIQSQVEVAIEDADVLILVGNVQDGIVSLDEEVARRVRASGKPVLFAANKCDNPSLTDQAVEFMQLGFDRIFPVSCLHRSGINALVEEAMKELPKPVRVPTPAPEDGEDGLRERNPEDGGEAVANGNALEEAGDAENAEAASGEASGGMARKINIAVVGRPNVGKSSLVNALLGEERVMVSDVAGTTRDAIDIDFELRFRGAQHPATLVDTAGLRKTAKVDTIVEYFSVMRAKSAINRADLVLFLVEASPDGVTAQDRRIASVIQESGKGCVVVANKFDIYKDSVKVKHLEAEIRYSMPGMSYAPLVFVSAKDKWNLDALLDRIAEVMEQLELKIPTGVLNRVIADAFESHTPPVIGAAPLKLFYASMIGMAPPKVLLFVNNPKYCADNYLTFLKNTVRNAFDLTGLPIVIELRERPKKVMSIRSEPGGPRRRGNKKKEGAPGAEAETRENQEPAAEKTGKELSRVRKKPPVKSRAAAAKPAAKGRKTAAAAKGKIKNRKSAPKKSAAKKRGKR